MDVYIQSEIGICQEYQDAPGGKKQTASIVISPLKVQNDDSGMTLRVVSGCNLWRGCYNAKCFYSQAARAIPKLRAQADNA
jgi:hypothetical protein